MEPVSSTRNQHVVRAGRLRRARGRREAEATILEGPHILAEAVGAGASVTDVFGRVEDGDARALAGAAGARWIPVVEDVLRKIADTDNPRGPVAIVQIPEPVTIEDDCIWLDTADPGNAGTLIRTAAAFGFGVVFASEAVDPWSPKVVRAAAGGHFRTAIGIARPSNAFTVATIVTGGVPLDEVGDHLPVERPVCLLIGNEAHGLPASMIEVADLTVSIPMIGDIESLNAAVAGAICMYEVMGAHRSPRAPGVE